MPNLLWWSKSLLCWWSKSLLRWWSKSLAAVRFNASPLRLRSVIDKKWSKSRGIKYPEALDFYDYYKGQMEAWDGPTLLLFRSSGTIMAYVGIELSSPTLASALLNLVPAFTFILALIFRMEEVRWRNSNSQVKVLGTIASIAGEFIVILYKGPLIFKKHSTNFSNQILQFLTQLNWILGGIFCIADSLFLLQCGTYIRLR